MPPPTAVHPRGAQDRRRNFEKKKKKIMVDHEIGEDEDGGFEFLNYI